MFDQCAHTLAAGLDAGKRGDDGRAVLAGLQVAGFLDLATLAAVEAIEPTLALAPDVALFDHAFDIGARLVYLAVQVTLGQSREHGLFYVRLQVDANQVQQAKDTGFGDAHGFTDDRIGLLDGEPNLKGKTHRSPQPQDANAVGDKAGRILAVHHRFAQQAIAKSA